MNNLQNFMKKALLCCLKRSRFLIFVTSFLFVNILLKMFLIDVCRISGDSMCPTLKDGDYVVLCKYYAGIRLPRNMFEVPWIGTLAYYFNVSEKIDSVLHKSKRENFKRIGGDVFSVRAGDLVAFNDPLSVNGCVVKRCVGLPGEPINQYIDKNSLMFTPFSVIPYKGMRTSCRTLGEKEKTLLRKHRAFEFDKKDSSFVAVNDCYIMLGDNRRYSLDSRSWGVVSKDLFLGKVIYVFPTFNGFK